MIEREYAYIFVSALIQYSNTYHLVQRTYNRKQLRFLQNVSQKINNSSSSVILKKESCIMTIFTRLITRNCKHVNIPSFLFYSILYKTSESFFSYVEMIIMVGYIITK